MLLCLKASDIPYISTTENKQRTNLFIKVQTQTYTWASNAQKAPWSTDNAEAQRMHDRQESNHPQTKQHTNECCSDTMQNANP